MNWFRQTLRNNRVILLTVLTVNIFYMVEGARFVEARELGLQEEERHLEELSAVFGIPREKLRGDGESVFEPIKQLVTDEVGPAVESGYGRLRKIVRQGKDRAMAHLSQTQARVGELIGSTKKSLTSGPQAQIAAAFPQERTRPIQAPETARVSRAPRARERSASALGDPGGLTLPLRRVAKKVRTEKAVATVGPRARKIPRAPLVVPRQVIPKDGIAPEIIALAESLSNYPSRIFRRVHDGVDFDPKWGVHRTPLGTLHEGKGTAWDQAWLLHELLSAAGVDARFQWGEVEIPTALLLNLTGVEDPWQAGNLMTTAGVPIVLVVQGSQVLGARMSHVWLRAHLDYIPNMGVTPGPGDTWVRMDPSLNRFAIAEGVRLDDQVPFDLGEYLESGTPFSPRQVYEEALQTHIADNHLGIPLEEVKPSKTVIQEAFPFVPGTLRVRILNFAGQSPEVPAAFQQQLDLELRDAAGSVLSTWSTPWSAVYGQRLEVAWPGATSADQAALDLYGGVFATPPYEVDLKPVIRVDGVEVAAGGAIGSAEDVVLLATITPPQGSPTVMQFELLAGEHGVFTVDFGQMPQEVIDHYTQELSAATDPLEQEAWTLALAGALYQRQLSGDLEHLAGLRWQRLVQLGTAVLAGVTWTSTYDNRGNQLSTTDALGAEMTFTYDAAGNLLTETNALGHTTQHFYDGFGRRSRTVNAEGVETSFTYNDLGDLLKTTTQRTVPGGGMEELVTVFEVDAVGRITSKTYPDGSVELTEYTVTGEVAKFTDALGRESVSQYDLKDRPLTKVFPDGTTHSWTYDAEDRVVSMTDRNGRNTSFVHDAVGQRIETIFADGSSIRNGYDAAGRVVLGTDALGHTLNLTYDAVGRLISETDALGNSTTTTYDTGHRRASFTDARGNRTEFRYDDQGLMNEAVLPDSTVTRFEYDAAGRRVAMIDGLGQRSELTYDSLNRLVGAIDPTGEETRYAFDEQGNQILQVDANGHTIRFEYGQMGRMTKRILDDGSSETFEYDAVGNLVRKVDFLDREINYRYDVNDRLIERSYSDGRVIRFTYTSEGRRLTVEDERGITRYTYDDRDRFKTLTYPDGRELRYTYDASGNLVSLQADLGPAGVLETVYTYDAMNRLTSVTDAQGQVYSYIYDAMGQRVQQIYPNGLKTLYTYDKLNRLSRLETQDALGAPLQVFDYTLDSAGRRVGIDEIAGSWSYSYDKASRLKSERFLDGSGAVSEILYSYDAAGNRVSQSRLEAGIEIDTIQYTYDGRDRLISAGPESFVWDANGNLISGHGATLVWDGDNRLRQVNSDSGWTVDHRYDADGVRVETITTAPDGTTQTKRYLVDASLPVSQVIAETDGSGALVASYVRGHDGVSRQHDLLSILRPGETRFVHADGIGSVRELSDESGTITDRFDYSAFGALLDHHGSDPGPYLFASEAFGGVSGFYYNRARWLMPETGRWLSVDPWPGDREVPRTLHDYVYVRNNPVNVTDPLGQFEFTVLGLTFSLSTQNFGRANQSSRGIEFLTRGLRNKKWDIYFIGRQSDLHWLIPHFLIYAQERKINIGWTYSTIPYLTLPRYMLRGPGVLSIMRANRVTAFRGGLWIKIASHNNKQFGMWNAFAVTSAFAPPQTVKITYSIFGPFVGRSCLSWSVWAAVSAFTIQFFPVR